MIIDGDLYHSRLYEFITKYNNLFGVLLKIEFGEFINIDEEYALFNGQYITNRDMNFYVSNFAQEDIRDYDFKLVPDWKVEYNNQEHISGKVSIVDNNENSLLNFDYNDYTSLDSLIKKSLSLLDESKYYFDKVNIESQKTYDTFNIKIFVRERLSKVLHEAKYKVDYTNNPTEVREGQNGTKYICSDGTERIISPPINEILLVDTNLSDSLIIDSISVDKETYALDENVALTIVGRSKSALKDLSIYLSDWSKMKSHHVNGNLIEDDITYTDGVFTANFLIKIYDYVKNSNFTFDSLVAEDIYGNVTEYWTKVSFNPEELTCTIIDEPFQVNFKTTDVTFLGIQPDEFKTEYTTNADLVREGQNGSKLVYSDGSKVILTEPIAEVLLFDNEVAEIEPETDYTIYAHEVRAGIKGSKLVFSNGEEKIIAAPVSAVALYRNKVEEFDYSIVSLESSDVPFGERQLIQEGIHGRRVVFYDADGNVVDSLVVSAPVSRIE